MYIHIIAFIGIVGLNIIILGLVIYWYRNKMLSQYNSFLNKADEILGGKQIDMRYDESLDSAISERLNRIVEISNMQKEVAEQEHNTIKSLLSNISHQIRTPLANITLYAGLLKEEVKPAIILADEPTGNLDSRTSQDVLGLIKISSQNLAQTIVMITHNEEIAQMADRIIRIEDGKIVKGGE